MLDTKVILPSERMAKKIKFTYFSGMGRGELSRLILAHAGVEYEDDRTTFDQWPELKPKMPLNVLPVLYYDELVLSQSKTIGRFLAKEFGIAGKTNQQQAKADMIVDCITDVENARYKWLFLQDQTLRQAEKQKFETGVLTNFLNQMLKLLNEENGPFMTGGDMTWADIAIANLMDLCLKEVNIDKEKFGQLYSLKNQVFEIPNIKKYLAARPKTKG